MYTSLHLIISYSVHIIHHLSLYSRQLQYETNVPVTRPKSHTVSVTPQAILAGGGTYATILEGNRPLLNRNNLPPVDLGNLEDFEWYWGDVSKYVVVHVHCTCTVHVVAYCTCTCSYMCHDLVISIIPGYHSN